MALENEKKCYELILNYNCNARCTFCSQGSFDKSLNADFDMVAAGIYSAYKAGYRKLGFTGGEPLVNPYLLKAVALAKSVGFRFIRLQTNGIMLDDPAFCRKLVRAGLTFCKFSLVSDKPAEHDRLVGVPGAHRRAVGGVKNLRRLKIRLGNNILVNRSNYRRLPAIIGGLLELGISHFVVIYPVYTGAMAENIETLGVSLPACEKYFAGAARRMEKAGLSGEILFLNVPPCFLKGRESQAIGLDLFNTLVTDPLGAKVSLDDSSRSAKVRAPVCAGCAFRGRCGGVDAGYSRNYGFAGFEAVKNTARAVGAAEEIPRVYFSDNELCLLEILNKEKRVTTRKVLELAKNIVLCRDCADGNSVINSAHSLAKKGFVESVFERGRYYWRLKKNAAKAVPGGLPA